MKTFFRRIAEFFFAIIFVGAAFYPSLLGYSLATCGSGGFEWSFLFFVLLPVMYPIVVVAWLLLAVVVTVHIGVEPYHSGQRRNALFKWAVPMSVLAGVVLALFAVMAGLFQKCGFGF